MVDELKPCPFCGHAEPVQVVGFRNDWGHGVRCGVATCRGRTVGHETKAEAITAWNTRAKDAQIAALEAQCEALAGALEPFALMASEGVVVIKAGYVQVVTCAEYFHRARAALAQHKGDA
jgi:Lar family restriction alleviation protein